jgi:hypothetical protein
MDNRGYGRSRPIPSCSIISRSALWIRAGRSKILREMALSRTYRMASEPIQRPTSPIPTTSCGAPMSDGSSRGHP